MKYVIGYILMSKDGEIQRWGGIEYQTPMIPEVINLPSGQAQVHCPKLNKRYKDFETKEHYWLTEWYAETQDL